MKNKHTNYFFCLSPEKEKMLLDFKTLKQGTFPSQGFVHRTNQPNSVVTCAILDLCFRSLPTKPDLGHLSIYFEKSAKLIPIPP